MMSLVGLVNGALDQAPAAATYVSILERDYIIPEDLHLEMKLLGEAAALQRRPGHHRGGCSAHPVGCQAPSYHQPHVAAAVPQHSGDTEAIIYTLRPFATLPSVAPPARFIFPGFGFITAAAAQQGPLDRDLPHDLYESMQDLVHVSGKIYQGDSKRQVAIMMQLQKLWPDVTFTQHQKHDGSLVVAGLNCNDYLVCLIEFKNELYSSGDPQLQGVRFVQDFYFKTAVERRWTSDPVLQATGAPVLILTIAGPQWNIYGECTTCWQQQH
eukprot:jgi/Chrzof1/6196/Cz17g15050.t1